MTTTDREDPRSERRATDAFVRPLVFGLHMKEDAERYYAGGVMAIGFREAGLDGPLPQDVFGTDDERRICERFAAKDADKRSLKERNDRARALFRQLNFATRIRRGDIAVFANAELLGDRVALGVVEGEAWKYVADDPFYRNQRRVRWTHVAPAERFAVDGKNIKNFIAPRMTLWKLNDLFRECVLEVIAGDEDAVVAKLAPTPKATPFTSGRK